MDIQTSYWLSIAGGAAMAVVGPSMIYAYHTKKMLKRFNATLDQEFSKDPVQTYRTALNIKDKTLIPFFGIKNHIAKTMETVRNKTIDLLTNPESQILYNKKALEDVLFEDTLVVKRIC